MDKTKILLLGGALFAGYFLISKKSYPAPRTDNPYNLQMTAIQANVMNYKALIMKAGMDYDIDPAFIASIIAIESGGNPNEVTNEGFKLSDGTWALSYGLMQIRWTTAVWRGYTGTKEGLLDPGVNIRWGTEYLNYQLVRYGSLWAAISAYNAGSLNEDGSYKNPGYVQAVLNQVYDFTTLLNFFYPGYYEAFR